MKNENRISERSWIVPVSLIWFISINLIYFILFFQDRFRTAITVIRDLVG